MSDTTLVKKHLMRPFINGGTSASPSWVQVKKATENTISMNPNSEEREYISDESATTELISYKPSVDYGVTTYKGEPDFELFYDMYKNRYVGSDAQKEFLLVNLFDTVTVGTDVMYFAQLMDSTIVINDFNTTGTVVNATINTNGTPTEGYVTITDGEVSFTANDGGLPTFTLLTEEPDDWATNYTSYYTKSGTVYTAISDDTAPTFATDTYYSAD